MSFLCGVVRSHVAILLKEMGTLFCVLAHAGGRCYNVLYIYDEEK